MNTEIKNDSNLCFICLQESSDPYKCSNCGAEISKTIDDNFMFVTPKMTTLTIDFNQVNSFTKSKLYEAVAKFQNMYGDVFDLKETNEIVVVTCNELAQDRLVNELKEK